MPDGFRVEPEALEAYRSAMTRVADELAKVGTGTLAGATGMPGDCFGKVGAEVGLHGAFNQAVQSQVDGVASASGGLAALAKAVGDALTAYQQQQSDHAGSIKRSEQV